MKLDSIFFTPKAEVSFTSEEYELMLACSAVHYDGVCKDAGKDVREGLTNGSRIPAGFLFSAHRIHINTGHKPVTFTFRELDTLAKILEVGRYLDLIKPPPIVVREGAKLEDMKIDPTPTKGALALGLHMAVRRVLIALGDSTPPALDDPLNAKAGYVPAEPLTEVQRNLPITGDDVCKFGL